MRKTVIALASPGYTYLTVYIDLETGTLSYQFLIKDGYVGTVWELDDYKRLLDYLTKTSDGQRFTLR